MTPLAGKVAIVTGGSRGIGAASATTLADAGATVMILARDGDAAAKVADKIEDRGGQACGVACDVADYSAVEAAVGETVRRFGQPDILINNAGVIEPIGALAETDPAAWTRNIEINLIGGYNAVRATLPDMLAGGGGTIINVSSGAAHRPLQGWSAGYADGSARPGNRSTRRAGLRLGTGRNRYRDAGDDPRIRYQPGQQNPSRQLGACRSARCGNPVPLH